VPFAALLSQHEELFGERLDLAPEPAGV
jgi:hypothetical protein